MTDDEVLAEFRAADALLEGHFILSSGLRSSRYLQCARVLMDPRRGARLAEALVRRLPAEVKQRVTAVVAPAMGGVVVGHEVARALGVESMFLERPDGTFGLRRGFRLAPGQQVLMMEDVVTTGLSSREAIAAIAAAGGETVAAAALVDRSNGAADLGVPFYPLIRLDVPSYAPDALPSELAAVPAVKPGESGMIALALAAALVAGRPHPSASAPLLPLPVGEGKGAAVGGGKGEGETPDQVAKRYNLAGELLVAKGGKVLLDQGYGPIAPSGGAKHKAGERWRLASITKQVTAALVVRELTKSKLAVTAPIAGANGNLAGLTYQHLLQHHSGFANPDDTPVDTAGVPAFYRNAKPDLDYCVSKPAKPGAAFSYNNCDYWIAAAVIGFGFDLPPGMAMARAGEIGIAGFVGGKPEPGFQLASWGPAGGLMGTARAVFDFDRSLMTGKLLPPAALAELWKPEGNGSYQALGQWVFPGKLKGCAAPKRIVQRDGEIYGVQARNFILPDDDLVVIVFTNRSSDDFAIGEVWEGKGFAYDLVSAAVDVENFRSP